MSSPLDPVAALLRTIEPRYDRTARRLAERTVRRGTESFVRKVHLEASTIVRVSFGVDVNANLALDVDRTSFPQTGTRKAG